MEPLCCTWALIRSLSYPDQWFTQSSNLWTKFPTALSRPMQESGDAVHPESAKLGRRNPCGSWLLECQQNPRCYLASKQMEGWNVDVRLGSVPWRHCGSSSFGWISTKYKFHNTMLMSLAIWNYGESSLGLIWVIGFESSVGFLEFWVSQIVHLNAVYMHPWSTNCRVLNFKKPLTSRYWFIYHLFCRDIDLWISFINIIWCRAFGLAMKNGYQRSYTQWQ